MGDDDAITDQIVYYIDKNIPSSSHEPKLPNSDENETQSNSGHIVNEEVTYTYNQHDIKQLGFYKRNDMITPIFQVVRPHVCNVCNKSFKHLNRLKSHYSIHTGSFFEQFPIFAHPIHYIPGIYIFRTFQLDKKFACNQCDSSFRLQSSLSAHKRKHLGNYPWSCEVCGKCTDLKNC